MSDVKELTHWKKKFNYDYLGSYSLDEGKDLIATIKELKEEDVIGTNGQKEKCLVCHFTDVDKPMIFNRTNCKIVEKVYGTPYIEEWQGKRVQIYVKQNVKAFGGVTDALRIREFEPKDTPELAEAKAAIRQALSEYKGSDKKAVVNRCKLAANDVAALKIELKYLTDKTPANV